MSKTIPLVKSKLIETSLNQDKDWLLKGLRRGNIAFLIAPPDSGKGYVCLSLAYELATGLDLLGIRHDESPPLKTLYWPVEDAVENTSDRILEHFQRISESYQTVFEKYISLYDSSEPIACSGKLLNSPVANSVMKAKEGLIKAASNYDLLIIDTIREAMGSADEVNDDYIINSTLKEISDKAGVSILAVHHPTKNVARGVESVSSVSASGLSYTIANSRLHLYLSKKKNKDKTEEHRLMHVKANFLNHKERIDTVLKWTENSIPFIQKKMVDKLSVEKDNDAGECKKDGKEINNAIEENKSTTESVTTRSEGRKMPKVLDIEKGYISQESIVKEKETLEREQVIDGELIDALKRHRLKNK